MSTHKFMSCPGSPPTCCATKEPYRANINLLCRIGSRILKAFPDDSATAGRRAPPLIDVSRGETWRIPGTAKVVLETFWWNCWNRTAGDDGALARSLVRSNQRRSLSPYLDSICRLP
jgi:hypothetical protein